MVSLTKSLFYKLGPFPVWIWAILILIPVGFGSAAWAWQHRTVTAVVDYGPCQISYGDVIYEWEGEGEDPWNEREQYYQARIFGLRTTAPAPPSRNTIEAEPTRIATGGEHSCQVDFDETIDTAADLYRWNGARAAAVRLGLPDVIDMPAIAAPGHATGAKPGLAVPVYDYRPQAAVWVDDGAQALAMLDDEERIFWCINYLDCEDITTQMENSTPLKGDGFKFAVDNCPPGLTCDDDWYDTDLTGALIDDNLVRPFSLRLEAVSTYASIVGAEMVLVFKYPKTVTLGTAVQSVNGGEVRAGSSFGINLNLTKQGPKVEGLNLEIIADGQLIDARFSRGLETQLRELNKRDQAEIRAIFTVADDAEPGCKNTEISAGALSPGGGGAARFNVSYCVSVPETIYTYSVAVRGNVLADLGQFRRQTGDTLADSRGWIQAGISFREVEEGGDFTLWLAAPDQMTGFSNYCSSEYSCRVGRNVIINDRRWQSATDSWTQVGGSLRDYRHMVVNHEVGHFLGHGHYNCPGSGQLAPVMQQQSIDLEGCRFNPWPLPFEITAT